MAEKSGFFNARYVNGEYDRKYTADDYCDNLAVVIGNGVLRSDDDDLKVTASGMYVTVAAGRAWIKGHYYFNTAALTLAAVPAAVGGNRYDRVVVRFDKTLQNRNISIVYLQGVASNSPTKPALTRNENVYDICLADIYVTSGSSTLAVYDTRSDSDVCGWVYSVVGDESFFKSLDNSFEEWFEGVRDTLATVTIIKRYSFNDIVYSTSASNITVTIPEQIVPDYDPDNCFIEVFANGFFVSPEFYSVSGRTITFAASRQYIFGTVISVNVYKSIDGSGLDSIVDEFTELQQTVASMDGTSKFTYKLTGTDDNISLSQIAQALIDGEYDASQCTTAAAAFLNNLGSDFFTNLNDDAQITIYVEGQNLTATSAFAGAGTSASRFRWFSFGQTGSTDRKITFDFAKCQNISIVPASSTSNIIFYGTDIHVKNARVSVFTANSDINIDMVASSYQTGDITFEDCEFSVLTTGNVTLAQNGVFTNCRAYLRSSGGNCFAFCPKSAALIRVIGGTYFTYIKASGKIASVIYVYAAETDAVVVATNISCPTKSLSGYSQAYLSTALAGKVYISGVTSTQTSQGSYNEIVGQIWKSKN